MTGKLFDLNSVVFRVRPITSTPFNRQGQHLNLTKLRKTCSEAVLPI